MSENFQIKSGIICETVRREDNGKLFFIGVFASDIVASEFPATLLLCCVAIVHAIKSGEFEIDFQVLLDGKEQASGKGKIGFSRSGVSMLPIPNIVLKDLNAGTLRFQMREVGKDWQQIVDIPVVPPS